MAVCAHVELVAISPWVVRHMPQGEVIVSEEGFAHSAVQSLLHGEPDMQPQAWSW
jgi:hypothetical protein